MHSHKTLKQRDTEHSGLELEVYNKNPVSGTFWALVETIIILLLFLVLPRVVAVSRLHFWNYGFHNLQDVNRKFNAAVESVVYCGLQLVFICLHSRKNHGITIVPNQLSAAPVCEVPTDDQTAMDYFHTQENVKMWCFSGKFWTYKLAYDFKAEMIKFPGKNWVRHFPSISDSRLAVEETSSLKRKLCHSLTGNSETQTSVSWVIFPPVSAARSDSAAN